jgi:hypothetical protein
MCIRIIVCGFCATFLPICINAKYKRIYYTHPIYMHIYIHTHYVYNVYIMCIIYTCSYTYIRTYIHMYIHIHIYTHVYMCISVHMKDCMWILRDVLTYMYKRIVQPYLLNISYAYVCMCTFSSVWRHLKPIKPAIRCHPPHAHSSVTCY